MKKITTFLDLAINGSRPLFDQVLHVGRPNMGSREMFIGYVNDIFDSRWLSNHGPLVREFESSLASYLGVRHCVAMCNGTLALEIAVRALGLTGEVIVPSFTFIATAHALQWQEITPVFADIDPATHHLCPEAVSRMITPRTSGIVGVHLWGRAAPVDELEAIADAHGLQLMFDAAHAFGCTHHGRMIGHFGRCEVLSFHATKFFNTFEGGAVVTNDDELAQKMRLMQNFGFNGNDNVIYPGTNGKMTEINAAMGLVNLAAMGEFTEVNRQNYILYKRLLGSIEGLSVMPYENQENYNYQYIVVELKEGFPVQRDDVIKILEAENVLARKYFWPGCHNMLPYKKYYPHAGMLLPNTEMVAKRIIVLPTGMAVDEGKILAISDIFRLLSRRGAVSALSKSG